MLWTQTSLQESFLLADEILRQAVTGISELIIKPGLINLDFADVKMIMEDSGTALIGLGEGTGEGKAVQAVEQAMSSPLLESSIDGASGVLINFVGGPDLGLHEVEKAAELVSDRVDVDANIIFGATIEEEMRERVHLLLLATGFSPSRVRDSRKRTIVDSSSRVKLLADEERPPVPPAEKPTAKESNFDEDDLDIPSFLRRLKKK